MTSASIDPETIDDPDAPDITVDDMAGARRMDGTLIDPVAYMRRELRRIADDVERLRGEPRAQIEGALADVRGALAKLDIDR